MKGTRLSSFCFENKIVGTGAELRRLIYHGELFINGIRLHYKDHEDVLVYEGDRIRVGKTKEYAVE